MPTGYNEGLVDSDEEFVDAYAGLAINSLGQVFDKRKDKSLPIELIDGVPYVSIGNRFDLVFLRSKKGYIAVADLVALVFKDMEVSLDKLKHVSAYPVDGNELNLHPRNLVWIFPAKGIKDERNVGFYYIPGFTKYGVNDANQVMNLGTKHVISPQIVNERISYGLSTSFSKSFTAGLYRILSLTFSSYPRNVADLSINHIDRKPGNNAETNREWVTQAQNSRHRYMHDKLGGRTPERWMYETGEITAEQALKLKEREAFKVLDSDTGEIRYFTIRMAAVRVYDLFENQVDQALAKANQIEKPDSEKVSHGVKRQGSHGFVRSRYLFRFLHQSFPEDLQKAKLEHMSFGGQARPVIVKNIATGAVSEYLSARVASEKVGMSKAGLNRFLIKRVQPIPGGQYLIKYKDQTDDWVT